MSPAPIGTAHGKARQIPEGKRAALDSLASLLLERKTIEGDELPALIGATPAAGWAG